MQSPDLPRYPFRYDRPAVLSSYQVISTGETVPPATHIPSIKGPHASPQSRFLLMYLVSPAPFAFLLARLVDLEFNRN